MRKIRCPKCRSMPDSFKEIWNYSGITWSVSSEGLPEKVTGHDLGGDPAGVEATCGKCGHFWKIRNVSQITDLKPDENE